MLNASHYLATETLPNGLRLLIRATEPHDDLAGAIQRKASPRLKTLRVLWRIWGERPLSPVIALFFT